jgi:hypothetical protein
MLLMLGSGYSVMNFFHFPIVPGKNMLSKMGKKSFVLEDNRRSSYNMSNQPITRSDSTFMTFESGTRQLVTVRITRIQF